MNQVKLVLPTWYVQKALCNDRGPFVRLSVPLTDSSNGGWWVCCWAPVPAAVDQCQRMPCCRHQCSATNSIMLRANELGSTQTCHSRSVVSRRWCNDKMTSNLQLVSKQRLELLLQAECEREPAHVTGVTALPEVHHAAEIILHHICVVIVRFRNTEQEQQHVTNWTSGPVLPHNSPRCASPARSRQCSGNHPQQCHCQPPQLMQQIWTVRHVKHNTAVLCNRQTCDSCALVVHNYHKT